MGHGETKGGKIDRAHVRRIVHRELLYHIVLVLLSLFTAGCSITLCSCSQSYLLVSFFLFRRCSSSLLTGGAPGPAPAPLFLPPAPRCPPLCPARASPPPRPRRRRPPHVAAPPLPSAGWGGIGAGGGGRGGAAPGGQLCGRQVATAPAVRVGGGGRARAGCPHGAGDMKS